MKRKSAVTISVTYFQSMGRSMASNLGQTRFMVPVSERSEELLSGKAIMH